MVKGKRKFLLHVCPMSGNRHSSQIAVGLLIFIAISNDLEVAVFYLRLTAK